MPVSGAAVSFHGVVGIRSSFRRHLLTNPGMKASPESHRAIQIDVSTSITAHLPEFFMVKIIL